MLNNLINEKVLEGVLPIAFLNSKVITLEKKSFDKIKEKTKPSILNKKYNQIELPEPNSNVLISKIYDFY
jgi:hypothetical protein